MTTLTIDVPDAKATELSKYAKKIGGHVVEKKSDKETDSDEDEVTHGVFFGENIKRAINAFKIK